MQNYPTVCPRCSREIQDGGFFFDVDKTQKHKQGNIDCNQLITLVSLQCPHGCGVIPVGTHVIRLKGTGYRIVEE